MPNKGGSPGNGSSGVSPCPGIAVQGVPVPEQFQVPGRILGTQPGIRESETEKGGFQGIHLDLTGSSLRPPGTPGDPSGSLEPLPGSAGSGELGVRRNLGDLGVRKPRKRTSLGSGKGGMAGKWGCRGIPVPDKEEQAGPGAGEAD